MKIKDTQGKEFKFYNVVKDDYPELEGKIIDYGCSQRWGKALVVGCNRSVGLTIVNASDKTYYLVCFRGPVSAEPSDESEWLCTYNEIFDLMISMIEKGKFDTDVAFEALFGTHLVDGNCSGGCAYSQ